MKYTDVCSAKTKEAMVEAFDQLCREVAEKHGGTPESHRAMQLHNVGYFAGYYDRDTYNRVMDWLGTSHPIFGTAYPSPTEAFASGAAQAADRRSECDLLSHGLGSLYSLPHM